MAKINVSKDPTNNSVLPWKTFRMYVHTQVCSSFNKPVPIGYPKSFLSFTYRLPFDGSSLSQNRRCCDFFKHLYLLWGCSWRRLWTYKGIMHSTKMDKICNKPYKEWNLLFVIRSRLSTEIKSLANSKRRLNHITYRGGRSRALQI